MKKKYFQNWKILEADYWDKIDQCNTNVKRLLNCRNKRGQAKSKIWHKKRVILLTKIQAITAEWWKDYERRCKNRQLG